MKLIIDIDEKTYNKFKKGITDIEGNLTVRKAVRNATPLQAELEEIKKEINLVKGSVAETQEDLIRMETRNDDIEIIDQRIAELKGENKQTDIPFNPYKLFELKGDKQ